ncbi:MAG: hypothetical protein AAF483_17100, partial [Planctomycetota bacterium]
MILQTAVYCTEVAKHYTGINIYNLSGSRVDGRVIAELTSGPLHTQADEIAIAAFGETIEASECTWSK